MRSICPRLYKKQPLLAKADQFAKDLEDKYLQGKLIGRMQIFTGSALALALVLLIVGAATKNKATCWVGISLLLFSGFGSGLATMACCHLQGTGDKRIGSLDEKERQEVETFLADEIAVDGFKRLFILKGHIDCQGQRGQNQYQLAVQAFDPNGKHKDNNYKNVFEYLLDKEPGKVLDLYISLLAAVHESKQPQIQIGQEPNEFSYLNPAYKSAHALVNQMDALIAKQVNCSHPFFQTFRGLDHNTQISHLRYAARNILIQGRNMQLQTACDLLTTKRDVTESSRVDVKVEHSADSTMSLNATYASS